METVTLTRRERRAERQRRYAAARKLPPEEQLDSRVSVGSGTRRETAYDAPLPGWLRPLDYKVSGETGALKVPSKVRTWHLGGRANGHAPPPGRGVGPVGAGLHSERPTPGHPGKAQDPPTVAEVDSDGTPIEHE